MDKRIICLFETLCELEGVEKTMEIIESFRKKLGESYLKEYPYIYRSCWFYRMPIDKERRVMRGVIVERYTNEHNGDFYFRFFGEDGKIHNDDDDCVMGYEREKIETYLNELRDDMIAGGDL